MAPNIWAEDFLIDFAVKNSASSDWRNFSLALSYYNGGLTYSFTPNPAAASRLFRPADLVHLGIRLRQSARRFEIQTWLQRLWAGGHLIAAPVPVVRSARRNQQFLGRRFHDYQPDQQHARNTEVVHELHRRQPHAGQRHRGLDRLRRQPQPAEHERASRRTPFITTNTLENLPAFANAKDSDNDGLPDAWEDANTFNKFSAAERPRWTPMATG